MSVTWRKQCLLPRSVRIRKARPCCLRGYPGRNGPFEDAGERYVVSHSEERTNRNVKNGVRAGFMVVETSLDAPEA
jgi:hypothetical protein